LTQLDFETLSSSTHVKGWLKLGMLVHQQFSGHIVFHCGFVAMGST
jgi:hypothetical protein